VGGPPDLSECIWLVGFGESRPAGQRELRTRHSCVEIGPPVPTVYCLCAANWIRHDEDGDHPISGGRNESVGAPMRVSLRCTPLVGLSPPASDFRPNVSDTMTPDLQYVHTGCIRVEGRVAETVADAAPTVSAVIDPGRNEFFDKAQTVRFSGPRGTGEEPHRSPRGASTSRQSAGFSMLSLFLNGTRVFLETPTRSAGEHRASRRFDSRVLTNSVGTKSTNPSSRRRHRRVLG
jgi:hypothetical protein